MKKLLLTAAITASLFAGHASATAVVQQVGDNVHMPMLGTIDGGTFTATGVDFSTKGVQDVRNVPLNQILYIAGSSAAEKFVEATVMSLAKTNTKVYKYYKTKDIMTYVITAKGLSGTTADRTYVIHYRNRDGSLMAVSIAAAKTPDKATGVTFNSLAGFAASAGAYTCGAPSSNLVTCTPTSATNEVLVTAPKTATSGASVSSVLGLSDVDAPLFASPLNGANTANALAKTTPLMGTTAIAAQVFGVAVNTRLRDAMQVAEIASGGLPNTCTEGSELEECMPNFTTEQLTSIFANGRSHDWKKFGNLWDTNSTKRPANTAVHICSRTAGSGSLATFNAEFENAPCLGSDKLGAQLVSDAIQAATSTTILPVQIDMPGVEGLLGAAKAYHSMVSSGGVDSCLTALNNTNALDAVVVASSDAVVANPDAIPPVVAKAAVVGSTTQNDTTKNASIKFYAPSAATTEFRWAVGIINANRNNTNALPYRFVKVDGVSPTLANTASGKYKFWSELSYITATKTTQLSTLADAFVKVMSDPAAISNNTSINLSNANFGKTGYLATAASMTSEANAGLVPTVMPFTHANASNAAGSVNHCRFPSIIAGKDILLPGLMK